MTDNLLILVTGLTKMISVSAVQGVVFIGCKSCGRGASIFFKNFFSGYSLDEKITTRGPQKKFLKKIEKSSLI